MDETWNSNTFWSYDFRHCILIHKTLQNPTIHGLSAKHRLRPPHHHFPHPQNCDTSRLYIIMLWQCHNSQWCLGDRTQGINWNWKSGVGKTSLSLLGWSPVAHKHTCPPLSVSSDLLSNLPKATTNIKQGALWCLGNRATGDVVISREEFSVQWEKQKL